MNSDVVLAGVDVSSFFVFLGGYVRLVKDVGVERLQCCILAGINCETASREGRVNAEINGIDLGVWRIVYICRVHRADWEEIP